MNKPIPVKIVEVLGWMYVALAVLLVGGAVAEACQPGHVNEWIAILVAFAPLALGVGMVLSLRRGRRFWFLLGHTVIGLLASAALLTQIAEGSVMTAASCLVAPIFVAAPFFLLCCSAANRWAEAKSGNGKSTEYGCGCAFVGGLLLFLLVFVFPMFTCYLESDLRRSRLHHLAAHGRAVFVDMIANRQAHVEGAEWIDPAACTNSTQFIRALVEKAGHDIDSEDFWCVAVNPPDDDLFPVLVTANIDPRELLNPSDADARLTLVCPKKVWGGVCRDFCEKGAVVVYKNGVSQTLKRKWARPWLMFRSADSSRDDIPIPRPDTYYLTPTGRVEVLSNQPTLPLP